MQILFLDDNAVYLNILYKRIERHAMQLEYYWDCVFDIRAYTSAARVMENVHEKQDLAFLDFNLEGGLKATEVLRNFEEKKILPSVVVFSEGLVPASSLLKYEEHVQAVLRKDSMLLPRSCVLIEDFLISQPSNAT